MNKEQKVLVTGGRGQLGIAMSRVWKEFDFFDLKILGHTDCDITNRNSVEACLFDYRPDWVINAAAWTNTATKKTDPDAVLVKKVNAESPVVLADVSRKVGARFIQISTDFVFCPNGVHMENKTLEVGTQVNWYGETKALAEQQLLNQFNDISTIMRVSATFGPSYTNSNFVRKVLSAAIAKKEKSDISPMKCVYDEIVRPTSTYEVARGLYRFMISPGSNPVYHLVSSGSATRFEQMRYVLENAGFDYEIEPVSGCFFDASFNSPRISLLENSLLPLMPSWQIQTLEVLEEIKESLVWKK